MNEHESTPQNTTPSELNQQILEERRRRAAALLGTRVPGVMEQFRQDVDTVVEFYNELREPQGTPMRKAV